MRKLYVNVRYFSKLHLHDFIYDFMCIVAFFLVPVLLYYNLRDLAFFANIGYWLFVSAFYEIFLWPLPFIFVFDWHYRLAFESFIDWLEAQLDVLSANSW